MVVEEIKPSSFVACGAAVVVVEDGVAPSRMVLCAFVEAVEVTSGRVDNPMGVVVEMAEDNVVATCVDDGITCAVVVGIVTPTVATGLVTADAVVITVVAVAMADAVVVVSVDVDVILVMALVVMVVTFVVAVGEVDGEEVTVVALVTAALVTAAAVAVATAVPGSVTIPSDVLPSLSSGPSSTCSPDTPVCPLESVLDWSPDSLDTKSTSGVVEMEVDDVVCTAGPFASAPELSPDSSDNTSVFGVMVVSAGESIAVVVVEGGIAVVNAVTVEGITVEVCAVIVASTAVDVVAVTVEGTGVEVGIVAVGGTAVAAEALAGMAVAGKAVSVESALGVVGNITVEATVVVACLQTHDVQPFSSFTNSFEKSGLHLHGLPTQDSIVVSIVAVDDRGAVVDDTPAIDVATSVTLAAIVVVTPLVSLEQSTSRSILCKRSDSAENVAGSTITGMCRP